MEVKKHRLVESLEEALEHAQGNSKTAKISYVKKLRAIDIPTVINVKGIRENLHMSQAEFAARFGMNLNTLRNWEHGRRIPDIATKAYLYAISRHADLVEKALYS